MPQNTVSRLRGEIVEANGPLKRLVLTDEDRENVAAVLHGSPGSPAEDFERFRSWALRVGRELPAGLRALLRDARDRTMPQPLLLVHNGPRDPSLPPTPTRAPGEAAKRTFVSEGFLTVCAEVLGTVFAFSAERNGRPIHDVVPAKEHLDARSSSGSAADLDLHTEAAFHSRRPDFVVLVCLRNPVDEGSPTVASSTIEALARLDAADLGRLSGAAYRFAVPAAFVHPPGRLPEERLPILRKTGFGWDVRVNCNPGHTVAVDAPSAESLTRLTAALTAAKTSIWLEPGDLLVVDNKRAAHGRPAFRPRFSENGRWLQRVYVRAGRPLPHPERAPARAGRRRHSAESISA
jgi:L-asparagine oxygenase